MKYIISIFCLWGTTFAFGQDIIYIDANSTASNPDGSSWAKAYINMASQPSAMFADEFWIADGVYTGSVVAYNVNGEAIKVYGGFSGNETSADQRDPETNLSVFNSYGPQGLSTTSTDVILDGIIWNNYGSTSNSCNGQFASVDYGDAGSWTLNRCKFLNFDYSGSRLFNACLVEGESNEFTLQFNQCEFNNVKANSIHSPSYNDVHFHGCVFENCESASAGTTFLSGCEVFGTHFKNQVGSRLLTTSSIFSCLFEQCDFDQGGPVNNYGISGCDVVNCTFVGNTNDSSFVRDSQVWNCIENENVTTSQQPIDTDCTAINCLLETEHVGGGFGNFYSDPDFSNPGAGDFTLNLCSPAVNASAFFELSPTDLAGNPRTQNGIMDLGCYELQVDIPDRIYVDINANGAGTGENWNDAITNLSAALSDACPYSEVWVAQGNYTPTGSPVIPVREHSFIIEPGVEVYGGFDGTETTIQQRDFTTNFTILSGAIGAGGLADNSYNVVEFHGGIEEGSRLDGFIVANGNANGSSSEFQRGAGVSAILSKGTIANCFFTNNHAYDGGAIQITGNGDLTIIDCFFVDNSASDHGGAIHSSSIVGLQPNAWIDRCEFRGNQANFGAALGCEDSQLTLTNSLLRNNYGASKGDACYTDEESFLTVRNLTVVNHDLAIFNAGGFDAANCIFWNNSQHFDGDGDLEIEFCNMEGISSGTGNIDVNPQFNDPDNDDYTLPGTSPSVNAGSTAKMIGSMDLNREFRLQNVQVDQGAYEYQTLCNVPNDFCTDAIVISDIFSGNIIADLACGSVAWETLSSCATDGKSIWYEFQMPSSSAQIVIYPSNNADVNFTLFTGDCNGLTEIVCIDNNGAGNGEGYALQSTEIPFQSTTYLRVGGDVNNAGEVTIEITELNCVITQIEASNVSGCGASDQYQQELTVHHSHPPGTGYLVVNDNYFSIQPSPQTVVLEFEPANGLSVDVFAYFTEGPCTYFDEDVYTRLCCVSNDDCALAIPLGLGEIFVDDNLCALGGGDYQTPCTGTGGRSVWYSFIAPPSGEVIISNTLIYSYTSNFNLRQAVFYEGCGEANYVACSNSGLPNDPENGTYSGLTPGEMYYLRIDGTNAQRASFTILVEEVISNNCPADFDNSGFIDTSDLLFFLTDFNCTANCAADLTGDDQTNTEDLLEFLTYFGTNC